jgi:ACS family hexuronate transporter-like MFS transporter
VKKFVQHWWPVVLMMGLSLLSYLDRQCFAVLSPTILSQTHLTAAGYGTIISAFSIAYMVCNPVWGLVLDRMGARFGLLLAVTIWTIASVSHGFVAGFAGFAIVRALLGVGEGATFPGVLRTVSDTLPPADQGRGIALGYSGIAAASILAPILFIPIAGHFGWRAAFLSTGLLGLGWIFTCFLTLPARKLPRPQVRHRMQLPNLLERPFWIIFTTYAMGAAPLGAVLYLSPLYLRTVGYSQSQLLHVLWIPPVGWEAGSFFWAWIMDRFTIPSARPRTLLWALGVLSLPLLTITETADHTIIIGLFFWSMFIAGGFVVVALRSAALWYPLEKAGLVAGLGAGSWSAIIALLLPYLGHLFDVKQFGRAFACVALIPAIGVLAWTIIAIKKPDDQPTVSSAHDHENADFRGEMVQL